MCVSENVIEWECKWVKGKQRHKGTLLLKTLEIQFQSHLRTTAEQGTFCLFLSQIYGVLIDPFYFKFKQIGVALLRNINCTLG